MGGFAGAVARALTGNTLAANLAGSFALAFFLSLIASGLELEQDTKLSITAGFFGAYTTFSTLCGEVVGLIREGSVLPALSYVFLSVAAGLAVFYAGWFIASLAAGEGRKV